MALTTQEAKPPPPDPQSKMENNAPETGQSAAAGGVEAVNVWERPWTVDEMRQAANDWSLAGDAGMLQYLQDFSQRIISRTHDIQEQVNGLVHESKLTGIRVQGAFNDFIMLANTQFVENRVYDEDVNTEIEENSEKKDEKEKTREEREAALIPKIVDAMKLGFNVIDTAFEKLDVNDINSDSEDEEESTYQTDTILEPKDPYLSRALPYLIGSQAFMTDDDVGLNDVLSEEDQSDRGSLSASDSSTDDESESEEERKPARKPTIITSDSDSASESETDSEIFGTKDDDSDAEPQSEEEQIHQPSAGKPSFANELSAKLGAPGSSEVKEKKERKERSSSKAKVPKEKDDEDLFGPPPMEDEDSPFGKKGGLFSSSGGGLFDDDENEGGLFDDVIEEKPRPPAARPRRETTSGSEQEEEPKPKEPTSRPRTKSGRKVPVGGVSIFGGGDDDLFGGNTQTTEDEDLTREPAKSSVPEKTRPQPAPTTTAPSGGLFDDDEDDLFAAVPPKKEAPKKAPEVNHQSGLFNDDDDDLFAAAAPTAKEPPPRKDDKPKKKLPPGAVSMFGTNSNPLAAAIKAQRPPSDKEESEDEWEDQDKGSQSSGRSGASATGLRPAAPAGAVKKDVSPSASSNSLFAEEPQDDLFATATSKPKPAVSKAPAKGLFGEDSEEEDLFATTTKPKTTEAAGKGKARATSLFLDDEDEGDGGLFGAKPASTVPPADKKKPAPPGDLFNDDLFNEVKDQPPPPKKEPAPKVADTKPAPDRPRTATTLSLFDDDDEDDLFGRTPPPPPSTETTNSTKGTKPRTRSLFADEDVLFGGSAEEDPAVDLFGASSPLSPSKESKPFPPPASPPSSPATSPPGSLKDKVEVKGATTSASSTDLFTGADVFTPPTKQQDPKLEVKGATVSESSTDKSAKGKKKPVGGVSMFGGMDPTTMLKRRAGSHSAASTPEDDKPQPPDLPVGSPDSDDNFMSAPKPEAKPVPSTMPKPVRPTRSTSIGKLQANLGIRPTSLLPGAAPPARAPQPTPAGFDEPVKATTLHTVQKDRVRGQTRRRPPTRKSRVISGQGLVNGEGESTAEPVPDTFTAPPANTALPTRPNPQRDLFGDDDDMDFGAASAPATTRSGPTVSGAKAPLKDPSPTSSQPANLPKATSDIFSAAFAKSKGVSKVRGPLDNDKQEDSDLFSGATKKPEKKVIVDISDDLFETPVPKSSAAQSSRTTEGTSAPAKPAAAAAPPAADGDIFSELGQQPKKTTPRPTVTPDDDLFSDDLFATPTAKPAASKKSTIMFGDDEEDLFATAEAKSSTTKKQPKATKTQDSLLEDNIFADLPPSKTREKKTKKKTTTEAKSIFDDDVDDIFAEAAKPKSKKTASSKRKAAAADGDIFGQNDDAANIFDDPLSAMKH